MFKARGGGVIPSARTGARSRTIFVAGSVGAGVSPGIAKAVGGDAGSTGMTEVDPDLACAVFRMRGDIASEQLPGTRRIEVLTTTNYGYQFIIQNHLVRE